MLTSVFDMFARSPVKPLQNHMHKANEAVKLLAPFWGAMKKQNWNDAEKYLNKIKTLENEADALKKDIRIHLPKSLFLPIARGDLLRLVEVQDWVANKAKDIAGIMFGRKMQVPAELLELFNPLLERAIDATSQANKAISELGELLESGFRGKEVQVVEDMIHKLDKIEHETDEIQIEIRQRLFGHEKDLPPVDVMFLYQVIEWIGELADRAQQVGARLLLLLAR